jgi:hypothetical protein
MSFGYALLAASRQIHAEIETREGGIGEEPDAGGGGECRRERGIVRRKTRDRGKDSRKSKGSRERGRKTEVGKGERTEREQNRRVRNGGEERERRRKESCSPAQYIVKATWTLLSIN